MHPLRSTDTGRHGRHSHWEKGWGDAMIPQERDRSIVRDQQAIILIHKTPPNPGTSTPSLMASSTSSIVESQQIRQSPQFTPALAQEITSQNLVRRGPVLHRDRQALAQENLQFPTQSIRMFQRGRAIRRDQEERLQRLFVEVRGFRFDHFNGHDPERPHVDLGAVFALLDHFGSHPIGCADHGGAFGFRLGEFGAEAEVGCMEC